MLVPADLSAAIDALGASLRSSLQEDWTGAAGDLEWSVVRTVDHLVDVYGWYAAQLASGATRAVALDTNPHANATNAERLDALVAVSCVLHDVLTLAPPARRGWHWYGQSDTSGFLAMAVDETLVHGHDITTGLSTPWHPDQRLATGVLDRLFPGVEGGEDPWTTLLWASGRLDLPGRPLVKTWRWEVAPTG